MSKNLPVVYNTPTNSTYPLTVPERQGAIVGRAQVEAMRREMIKAHFADQAMEAISTSRMEHLASGGEAIWQVKDRPGRPKGLQDILDEAADSITLRLDAYLTRVTDLTASQIVAIQADQTYIRPEPQEKGFFRKRLKG